MTAGIDFGLVLLAKLRGEDAAKLTQLAMEYDPQPPFHAGSPKTAGPAIIEQAMIFMAAHGRLNTEKSQPAPERQSL